jgi:cell division protein FtsB
MAEQRSRTSTPRVAGTRASGTAAATDESAARARRTNLTGRAAVLALVVCVLAISLAYPLREWLAQRREIGALHAQVAQQQQRVKALQEQEKRWQDPAYVKAQARDRLHFVMPGETSYVVLDPDEAPAPSAKAAVKRDGPDPSRPWFTQLWQSAQSADKE